MSTEHPALTTIRTGGIVPLIASPDPDVLWHAAVAIAQSGLRVMEVALRSSGTIDALGALIDRVRSEDLGLDVGVGTVLDPETASAAIDRGAAFVFSPILTPSVGERCRSDGIAWFPGCATPTEVHTAIELGCDGVKVFPADTLGGPGFLRALRSVFGDLPAIPSGGVEPTPGALAPWFAAGATAVGVGSWLFPSPLVAAGSWSEVSRRLASAAAAVDEARESA